jgi:hypothetical protein
MRFVVNIVPAIAFVVAMSQDRVASAEQFTASGTWVAGKHSGTWQADVTREADTIEGQMQLTGLSISTADVAGTLRADQIEFGVISRKREIASFTGTLSPGQLGGTLTMAGGETGRWSGAWRTVVGQFAPLAAERPGTLEAPFEQPSGPAGTPGDRCDLVRSGGFRLLSGGGQAALQMACRGALESASASLVSDVGATSSVSCNPGLPESNPPKPPNIAGTRANNLSRPLQQWPRITQSETTTLVSLFASDKQAVAYNDTQFRNVKLVDAIGLAYLSASGWTQNSDQFVLPESNDAVTHAFADPSGAPDRDDRFLIASVAFTVDGLNVYQGIGVSTSTNFGFSYGNVERAINPVPASVVADKEWLAVDWTNLGLRNTKYLCWLQGYSDGPGDHTSIWFSRRLPASSQWDEPQILSDELVFAHGSDPPKQRVQGCQVAVAPDGSVVVVWWEERDGASAIIGRRAPANGSFGSAFNASGGFIKPSDSAVTADCSGSVPDAMPALKGHIRALPLPSLAIDRQNGAIYMAFMKRRDTGSGSDVAFVRSTNQGATWTTPPLVVSGTSAGDKFLPALAQSPYNRGLKIIWYDRRNDPNNLNIDLYGASSTVGGGSFGAPVRLTVAPFGVPHLFPNFDCCDDPPCAWNPSDCYMGDYNSIQGFPTQDGYLHAWGDNSDKWPDLDMGIDVPDPDIRVLAGC